MNESEANILSLRTIWLKVIAHYVFSIKLRVCRLVACRLFGLPFFFPNRVPSISSNI